MLDWWNSCNDFNQYALSSFWTVFTETQMLCQAPISQLTGAGEVSLQDMVRMLTRSREYGSQHCGSYIWIPVARWISGSSAILTKQKDARMAWDEYQAHITKKTTAIRHHMLLLSIGVALQEIQSTFATIGNNLGQAATLMAAADGSVRTSLVINQQAIQAGITKAVQEFQDTLSAVQVLVTIDSSIQTSGITADIDPPSVYGE
ncbi:uncharacterized protein BKA55DRAFT_741078 [Fusarium redolens]|uniref:Uncharacterized protein n=1 Tax=Fusarium redolens TaxID=48865 RepID=A0A9P9GI97_FUSRE|nr:uncharacterized protein BKA55DRAFT_741078 [Fusarium redolens]KAH7240003.1 hypothetical protein BKA55DRAFT_741078 [Fusarium redolens]